MTKMPTQKLTNNEKQMILAIVDNEYSCGDVDAGTWAFAAIAAAGMSDKAGAAVIGSLKTKGLAWTADDKDPGNYSLSVGLTASGKEYYEQIFAERETGEVIVPTQEGSTTMTEAVDTKPTRNEDGTYDLHGFRIERIHNRKWVITRPGHDFEGSTESLKKAVTAINNIVAEQKDEVVETLEEQAEEHAEQVAKQTKGKTAEEVAAPKAAKAGNDKLVGHKITVGIIHDIREGFDALDGGKVAYYRAKAKEHKLGVETVAKIARRDIYKQVD